MQSPRTVRVFAPAKVNLTLHVTGQRADGYHLIDSLVAFADIGDLVSIQAGNTLSLTIEGPEARGVPADMENLALRAAKVGGTGAALVLEKQLPAASGIGGGSADAAAALRGMMSWTRLGHGEVPDDALLPYVFAMRRLGADVMMCLASTTCRARGIGDLIELMPLPPLHAVLVNPRVPVATASVFAALARRENPPMPAKLPAFADAGALIEWLVGQRNDLEPVAQGIAPAVARVLESLRATADCRLARMSGSGATCFGLYPDADAAQAAAAAIRAAHADWWVRAAGLGDQALAAKPVSVQAGDDVAGEVCEH